MIHDAVRDGRITAAQGAMLLDLRADIEHRARRRAFWRGLVDGLTGGPLWRWIARFRR